MNIDSDSPGASQNVNPHADLIEASIKAQKAAEAAGIDLAELWNDGEISIVLTLLNQAMAAASHLIWQRCVDKETEIGDVGVHTYDDRVFYIPCRVNDYVLRAAKKRQELFDERKGCGEFMYEFQWLKDADKSARNVATP